MAIDRATAADFAALGATVEADEVEEYCEVWNVNWLSVLVFLQLETQWRCVSRGMKGVLHWLGLDYTAVVAVLDLRSKPERKLRSSAAVFADLRVLEREALLIMNEAS